MAEKEKPLWKQLWEASTAGLNLVISTFIGMAIGYALDKYVMGKWIGIKTFPWLTIIFLILGIVSGFRDLFRIASKK